MVFNSFKEGFAENRTGIKKAGVRIILHATIILRTYYWGATNAENIRQDLNRKKS